MLRGVTTSCNSGNDTKKPQAETTSISVQIPLINIADLLEQHKFSFRYLQHRAWLRVFSILFYRKPGRRRKIGMR